VAGMEFEYKKVKPNNRDFQSLITELNLSLRKITNDTGESSFVSDTYDPLKDGCIVVYLNDSAVACLDITKVKFVNLSGCTLTKLVLVHID
jgi:hypothetical protein